jgi:hypothetical protein
VKKDVSVAENRRNGSPESDGLTHRTRESADTNDGGRKTGSDGRDLSRTATRSWRLRRQTTSTRKLVSQWLHRLGVEVYQGRHRVKQLPLKIPNELAELLSHGPDHVLKFIDECVWGLTATESGIGQLRKFCRFIDLHKQGTRVLDIASQLHVHRSTVSAWRESKDQPYLVRAAQAALQNQTSSGEKLLPLHLDSGGNQQESWIRVPTHISNFSDIQKVVGQLTPLPQTYELGAQLGLSGSQTQSMRLELFAYLLGMMVGDLEPIPKIDRMANPF